MATKHCWKQRTTGCQHFLFFHSNFFQKPFLLTDIKNLGLCGKGLMPVWYSRIKYKPENLDIMVAFNSDIGFVCGFMMSAQNNADRLLKPEDRVLEKTRKEQLLS